MPQVPGSRACPGYKWSAPALDGGNSGARAASPSRYGRRPPTSSLSSSAPPLSQPLGPPQRPRPKMGSHHRCLACARAAARGAAGQAHLGGVILVVRIEALVVLTSGGYPGGTPGNVRGCVTCGRLMDDDKGERAVQDLAVRRALSPSPPNRSRRSRSQSRGATTNRAGALAGRKGAPCQKLGGSRNRPTRRGRSADGAAGRKEQGQAKAKRSSASPRAGGRASPDAAQGLKSKQPRQAEKRRAASSPRAGARASPDAAQAAKSKGKPTGRRRTDASSGGGRSPATPPRRPAPRHHTATAAAPTRAGGARAMHRTFSCVL